MHAYAPTRKGDFGAARGQERLVLHHGPAPSIATRQPATIDTRPAHRNPAGMSTREPQVPLYSFHSILLTGVYPMAPECAGNGMRVAAGTQNRRAAFDRNGADSLEWHSSETPVAGGSSSHCYAWRWNLMGQP